MLLFSFNAKSQTAYETEKWLEEKLYAFSSSILPGTIVIKKVTVYQCNIIVDIYINNGGKLEKYIEEIPITSSLLFVFY